MAGLGSHGGGGVALMVPWGTTAYYMAGRLKGPARASVALKRCISTRTESLS